MSASAASLQCPICFHSGVFETAESLRNRLIFVSTNKLSCPVCQEEVIGLDKLTIHLFSHVKLLLNDAHIDKNISENLKTIVNKNCELKQNSVNCTQPKKPKAAVAKNKTTTASTNQPVKFVKIYPKLPVVSLNAVTALNMNRLPSEESTQICNPLQVSSIKTETNTTCNICGLQFVDSNILRMHRCLIHNIEENSNPTFTRYDCHLCTKNFKMRGSLMVHLRVAHYGFTSGNSSTMTNTRCDAAGAESASDNSLSLVKNDNKQWQCDVCRKCFTTKYFLKKHKRLHTGETPYSCAQCSKTFTFQQSYHKHLLYHNDEKPHICNFCGRAFKELSTLHNHQRIHTGEKPFSCETCGKSFRQRVSYLVHRRIHTGVMPYKCTACDKSFRYKVSQRTHKCQAQPPGTVIRQAGDLVEKLKKKHAVVTELLEEKHRDHNESDYRAQVQTRLEVSEANAELVRSSAKLSFEDTETDNFTLIVDAFAGETKSSETLCEPINDNLRELLDSNFEDLIDAMPTEVKNVPSPSDILKKLCLTHDEDLGGQSENSDNYEILREFM